MSMESGASVNMELSGKGKGVKRKMSMTPDESLDVERSAKGKEVKRTMLMASNESPVGISAEGEVKEIAPSSQSTTPSSYDAMNDWSLNTTTPSSSSAMQKPRPLTEFHCFSLLHTDLRVKIWNFIFLSQPRDVGAKIHCNGDITTYSNAFSDSTISALFVNWEARIEAEKFYKSSEKCFLFNKNQDNLFMGFSSCYWERGGVPTELCHRLYSLGIKHLILNDSDWIQNVLRPDHWQYQVRVNSFFQMLVGMTELESIFLVTSTLTAEQFDFDKYCYTTSGTEKLSNRHPVICDWYFKLSHKYQEMSEKFQKEFAPEWRIPTVHLPDIALIPIKLENKGKGCPNALKGN
ncbi:hypothetical protein NHQ30_009287 [Ciborinia camelliae]|nr:hypothetical protein NHQ30_009287 [Ciborinia camelliae]